MTKNSLSLKTAAVAVALSAGNLSAANLQLTITNITFGGYFTPLLISAHEKDEQQQLFSLGSDAQDFDGVEAMAELGDISMLAARVQSYGATTKANPVPNAGSAITMGGANFLIPGGSVTVSLNTTDAQKYLSVAAMILPSNDAFVGLDSYAIPSEEGVYKVYLNAYDAGTEINTETVKDPYDLNEKRAAIDSLGIPSPSFLGLGSSGTGVAKASNPNSVDEGGKIHIHPSNLGDFDQQGGISDMNAKAHRFNNPVALVTIRVGVDDED